MITKYVTIICLSLFLVLPAACTFDPPELPLTKEERKEIDSIYIAESKIQKKEMDSLCDLRFNLFVDHAVDSIIEDRMQEIERLINRQ